MKVQITIGNCVLQADAPDSKEVFAQLSELVEVFKEQTCGACGGSDCIPVVRENGGNFFYNMTCRSCRAELAYGTRRADGRLYPRRKHTKTQEWLANDGWVKWGGGGSDFD